MDAFAFREKLITEYSRFSRSFVRILASDISHAVDTAYEAGRFCPQPLIQLNPNFKSGGSIDDLVSNGKLTLNAQKFFASKIKVKNLESNFVCIVIKVMQLK